MCGCILSGFTRYLFPFFVKFQYLVTMAALDVNVQLTDKQKHWAVEEVFGMLLVRMHGHTFTHKMTQLHNYTYAL